MENIAITYQNEDGGASWTWRCPAIDPIHSYRTDIGGCGVWQVLLENEQRPYSMQMSDGTTLTGNVVHRWLIERDEFRLRASMTFVEIAAAIEAIMPRVMAESTNPHETVFG